MKELHERFFNLRNQKDQLKQQLKEVQEQLNGVESDLLINLENSGLTQIKSETGTIYIRDEIYAKIVDEDHAFAWLRSNHCADLIRQTVNLKQLSATMKQHLENGQDKFPGIEASIVSKIGYRRNGGGE